VADSRQAAVAELRATMPGWLTRGVGAYRRVDGRPRPPLDAEVLPALRALVPDEASPAAGAGGG
jgi:hypothetical protein